jgi:hypothetical protein
MSGGYDAIADINEVINKHGYDGACHMFATFIINYKRKRRESNKRLGWE